MTIRVTHIITGLGSGGAEAMLYKISREIDPSRFKFSIISLSDDGKYATPLREAGIDVTSLNTPKGLDSVFHVGRLIKAIHKTKPHIVQGWMPHGNVAALAAYLPLVSKAPVLWNIRQTINDDIDVKGLTKYLIKSGRYLSRLPKVIIYNSHKGAQEHEAIGYEKSRRLIIPNGFDIERYKPSADIRAHLLDRLQLPPDRFIVGLIARYHPMKNHADFIRAAKIVADHCPNVSFVLAGDGITAENTPLQAMIVDQGLGDHVHLLGEQKDPLQVMAGLDLLVLSSAYGEGFPNVVGEAMSCAVPCVVTDVGDAALIVGNSGIVVPPNDTHALAQAILKITGETPETRHARGSLARETIMEKYSIRQIASQYETLYSSL